MLIKLQRSTRILGALLGVGGAGGAGFVYPDSATRPFADTSARDTWAAANLGDLLENQTIVQVGAVWYLWTGESDPASYDNTEWIDATPIIEGASGVRD